MHKILLWCRSVSYTHLDVYKRQVIRLKENGILREKASHLVDELDEITRNNKVDYAVVYGEFMYKAGTVSYTHLDVYKRQKGNSCNTQVIETG